MQRPWQEKLERMLDTVNKQHLERMQLLDQELERIEAEYLLLICKPATNSMPTYFLRMRRGPVTPCPDRRAGLAGRLARKMYYRLFGRWPRVTKLSPYWAALRHLRNLGEAAVDRGAKDMLIIGKRFGIPEAIVSVSGLCAWMSIHGLMTGGMGAPLRSSRNLIFAFATLNWTSSCAFRRSRAQPSASCDLGGRSLASFSMLM